MKRSKSRAEIKRSRFFMNQYWVKREKTKSKDWGLKCCGTQGQHLGHTLPGCLQTGPATRRCAWQLQCWVSAVSLPGTQDFRDCEEHLRLLQQTWASTHNAIQYCNKGPYVV